MSRLKQIPDLKKYFASFDALAVDPHQSWLANNLQRKNITSSYVDGLLQLRGFFFADRRDYHQSGVSYRNGREIPGRILDERKDHHQSGLSYMLYAVERPQPLVGYGVHG